MQIVPPIAPSPPSPADPGAFVFARAQPCLHCGYDLRSMELSAKCPECGGACMDALGSLAAASPEDVGAIVSGLRRMAIAAIGFPLLAAGLTVIDIRMGTRGPRLANVGAIGVGIVGPLLALGGVWRLSARVSPDASARPLRGEAIIEAEKDGMAIAAWVHAGFSILLTVVTLILVNEMAHNADEAWAWVTGFLAVGMGLGWAVRNAMVSRRCAEYAARSNAKGVRGMIVSMAWLSVGMGVVVVLYGMAGIGAYLFRERLSAYGPGRAGSVLAKVLVALQIAHGCVVVVWLGWLVLWPLMLGSMARHLGRVRDAAARGGAVLARRPMPEAGNNGPA